MIADILRNVSATIDGRGYAGKFDSVTLPTLEVNTVEHRGGGMDLAVELDMGLKPMQAMIESVAVDRHLLASWGVADGTFVPWTFRGALQGDGGTVTPALAEMRGLCTKIEWGDWKPGEKVALKATLALRFFRYVQGGVEVAKIDALNSIRIINGADQLTDTRAALGI